MATAVLDVGKTNKKLLIYDEGLKIVDRVSTVLPPTTLDEVSVEPIAELTEWFHGQLAEMAKRHSISAISIATHGAMFVCIDEGGEVCVPPLDYTHEPGGSFHEDFYRQVGDRDELQRTTATMELKALVNIGKGVFFAKRRFPEQFARTKQILMYPQLFVHQLTGRGVADLTMLGCHTYLWDPRASRYSTVADKLGVRELLPREILTSGEVVGTVEGTLASRLGLDPQTIVTAGIHDSNASLVPYLLEKPGEQFVLNSTGTWCVAMHPEESVDFREEEIGKSVFYNLSAFGTPVKTTILMAGGEFDHYVGILKRRTGISELPAYDPATYERVATEARLFVLPGLLPGTGQFPESIAQVIDGETVYTPQQLEDGSADRLFGDPERFYAALNLSLAVQTTVALDRVGLGPGVGVYTEGGFRNNPDYNALLAALYPDSSFALTGMEEATSFGAALLGLAASKGTRLESLTHTFSIDVEKVIAPSISGLREYARAFLSRLQ